MIGVQLFGLGPEHTPLLIYTLPIHPISDIALSHRRLPQLSWLPPDYMLGDLLRAILDLDGLFIVYLQLRVSISYKISLV